MIPSVSLRRRRGGSLSQLCPDGLKLPGQVYSAVTPFARESGAESAAPLSAGANLGPRDTVTPPRRPAALYPLV